MVVRTASLASFERSRLVALMSGIFAESHSAVVSGRMSEIVKVDDAGRKERRSGRISPCMLALVV